jgi:lipopolysaccharide exporter
MRRISTDSTIAKQSVIAVKWSALGTVVRYGLQLGGQIVLARLLGPENYGLFAMGMMVIAFSNFVADFGFAWGMVQAQHLDQEDIRFVFTWQLISGTLVALCLYALAPAVASYFNESRVEAIVRWLSLACVFNAVAAPASNLLKRDLNFRALNIIQVSSYAIGYLAIGVPCAYYGAGVWSLVAAWLTQALCGLLLSVIWRPYPVKPLLWHDGASMLSRVGLIVFVTNISNWFLNNLDRVVIGRFLAAHAVGLYVVGYNLATAPNILMVGAVQPTFLAAGARIQSEPDRLRRAYLSVIATVWVLIAPSFVLLAIVAKDLVSVLYGSAWEFSGIVLAILALSMPAFITGQMSTTILWNTGRMHFESLLQLPILAIAGFVFYNLASKGIVIVAIAVAGVLFARAIVITTAACRRLGIVPRDLLAFAMRGTAMALIAAASAFAGVELGRMAGTTHVSALVGGTLMGCSVLMTVSVLFPWLLGDTVIEMLGRFSPRLAAAFGNAVPAGSKKK